MRMPWSGTWSSMKVVKFPWSSWSGLLACDKSKLHANKESNRNWRNLYNGPAYHILHNLLSLPQTYHSYSFRSCTALHFLLPGCLQKLHLSSLETQWACSRPEQELVNFSLIADVNTIREGIRQTLRTSSTIDSQGWPALIMSRFGHRLLSRPINNTLRSFWYFF